MFSNLRQGSTLYVLEKGGDAPQLKLWQVVSVSNQKPQYNIQSVGLTPNNMTMVVDVKAKYGETEEDFNNLPCMQNITTYHNGGWVVTDNRDAMLSEIDGMKRASQQVVESVDYHKHVLVTCEEMLKALNPSYAKEQERDQDISQLKQDVNGLNNKLDSILKILSDGKTKK